MAYVPGFKYDIFISYAHLDNQKPFDAGWVEMFYKSLEWFLSERTGKMNEIKIWWDSKKLDGTTLFDNSISSGVEDSAIMISLVSKFYLGSEYCSKELDTFSKKAQGHPLGLQVGDRSRMVHVLLQNIPFNEWPSHFSGRTGFPFYIAPDKTRLGDTLKASSPEFISQMGQLRDSIEDLLNEFKNAQSEQKTETIVVPSQQKKDDAFSIYFADVTDSLITARKRTVAELEKKGFNIINSVPGGNIEEHKQNVKQALANADLSVHLLDLYPGREITADTINWYPKLEAELALQTDKPMMIWTPPLELTEVEEEGYKNFLSDLDSGKLSSGKSEMVRDVKSMITQHVADLATELQEKKLSRQIQQRSASEERTQVLIDTNVEDQISAWDLGRALLENGIQPVINPGEKDPVQNINILGDRMSQVQKLIFYYGQADKEWIKQRMNAALHMAMSKDLAIDNFFVFMAPPDKNPQEVLPKQKFIKVNLIDSSATSKELAIDELLKQLKRETA